MNPYLATSGIRLNDCFFSEPVGLAGWTPPQYAGLFAIFVRDPDWAPKPFQPLYFGEFGNNAPLDAFLNNYGALLATANGKNLLISVCPLPFSTSAQRWAARDELVWAYNPACQPAGNRVLQGDIAHRMKEMERKHQEQTAQLMRLLEPQPEPQKEPRRRIGFMPQCEPAR